MQHRIAREAEGATFHQRVCIPVQRALHGLSHTRAELTDRIHFMRLAGESSSAQSVRKKCFVDLSTSETPGLLQKNFNQALLAIKT